MTSEMNIPNESLENPKIPNELKDIFFLLYAI
jgi:hypothetical protein